VRWVALLLVGCGGTTIVAADAGDDSSFDATSDVSTGDVDVDAGPCPAKCPATLPDGPCDFPRDILCEYGSNRDFACNSTATCTNGTWHTSLPMKMGCFIVQCNDTVAALKGKPCMVECEALDGYCGCSSMNGYVCVSNPPGCPSDRPKLGAPCAFDQQCIYLNGPLCGSEECRCGVWQPVLETCTH
jgi:hypothetical protein